MDGLKLVSSLMSELIRQSGNDLNRCIPHDNTLPTTTASPFAWGSLFPQDKISRFEVGPDQARSRAGHKEIEQAPARAGFR